MTTSLRNLVRDLPFPLPQRIHRWSVAIPESNADPELMRRMEDEIVGAMLVRRLQEQGIEV